MPTPFASTPTRLKTASEYDDRLKATYLISIGGRNCVRRWRPRSPARPQLKTFLLDGWQAPNALDQRVRVTQVMNAGGSQVRRQAQTALNGTDDDWQAFLFTGQHTPVNRTTGSRSRRS